MSMMTLQDEANVKGLEKASTTTDQKRIKQVQRATNTSLLARRILSPRRPCRRSAPPHVAHTEAPWMGLHLCRCCGLIGWGQSGCCAGGWHAILDGK